MPIHARYRKLGLIFTALITGIFPVAGLAVAVMEIYLRATGRETGPFDFGILWFVPLVLVAGPMFVARVRRFFDNDVVLTVDETGILDRRWVDRPIPWSKISSSAVARLYGQKSIWLGLSAPLSDYTAGGWKRTIATLGSGTGTLVLSCTELSVPADTIQASIDHYLQGSRTR
ncbi:MAG: hypothetical protein HXX10_23935 [Rhodoplanes sp.]|uniref:hypothetical protein n=1 Tax=Rhodoplanes sp. TaxID=1968906 RepID=UPI0017DAED70|nr:hypothetical protein [Rhodoplanes sp.]NVO17087.1 hypothetical protein [Rhodoplanes sp.]